MFSRGEGFASHGVHVGERSWPPRCAEVVRIVDDRREEVHGLHEREVVGQAKDPRVIEGLVTDEQPGIGFARRAPPARR